MTKLKRRSLHARILRAITQLSRDGSIEGLEYVLRVTRHVGGTLIDIYGGVDI